jgi:hypothetical protein
MRSRRLLLAIIVICVVGRGAFVLYLAHTDRIVTTSGDAPTYIGPARELADHGRFDSVSLPGQPEFLRTPGYPAFIATVYRIFGENNTALLLIQVLLSGVTVLLAYLLAARMWSEPVGLIAAAFTAFDPLQSLTASTILTESLAALLLIVVAALGYTVFSQDRPRLRLWVLLGLAIAVATFLRPVTYYLPLLVLAMLLIRYARRRDRWLDLGKMLAAFLVPLVVLVGGWQLRNHERVDSWRFSGIEGKNLYLFRAAGVVAHDSGRPFKDVQHEMRHRFGVVGTESQGSYYGRMFRQGMHIVTSHPGAAAIGTLEGLWSEIATVQTQSFGDLVFGSGSPWIVAPAVISLVAFYALTLYGLVLVLRRRRELFAHAFVVGIAIYVLVVSAGPEALGGRGERFRAPIVPILILYAAFGAHTLYTFARRPRATIEQLAR